MIQPQLAENFTKATAQTEQDYYAEVEGVLNKQGYIAELKRDGGRTITTKDIKITLTSRGGLINTTKFPLIVSELQAINHSVVLDGEVIYNKEGKDDFITYLKVIQSDTGFKKEVNNRLFGNNLIYVVFDLLKLDGEDYTTKPLLERKAKLKEILPNTQHIIYSEHTSDLKGLYQESKIKGFEGIMLKRVDGLYHEGKRVDSWLKVKHLHYGILTATGYETNPVGITLLCSNTTNTNIRVACNGEKHRIVKEEIDHTGKHRFKIAYLEKSYTGVYRMPIYLERAK